MTGKSQELTASVFASLIAAAVIACQQRHCGDSRCSGMRVFCRSRPVPAPDNSDATCQQISVSDSPINHAICCKSSRSWMHAWH